MPTYPEQLKNELVMLFNFQRFNGEWRRSNHRPKTMRIGGQDCSRDYREPKLLGTILTGFVEVRIYDDQAIDVANQPTLLGDWTNALKQCEDFLECEIKKIPLCENHQVSRTP